MKKLRSYLNKLKFFFGLTPKILSTNEERSRFIPKTHKAVCLLSADFELAWAFRYSKSRNNPLERAKQLGMQTRKNIPYLISICEQYNIPITWATVGHLFLKECVCQNKKHPEILRIPKFENDFWKFESGDWFDQDPCTNYQMDPEWYCPDLIQNIINSKVEHEIGCHSFSHIDCSDRLCPSEVFLSEINTCQKIAKEFGITLKSFVHPGHQIGHLLELAEKGFTSFRTDYGDALGYPVRDTSGLWELKNTAIIDYRPDWSVSYHIKRYKTIIERAIKANCLCVLWFHPSFDPILAESILPKIFSFLDDRRDEILITTHHKYIDLIQETNLNGI